MQREGDFKHLLGFTIGVIKIKTRVDEKTAVDKEIDEKFEIKYEQTSVHVNI